MCLIVTRVILIGLLVAWPSQGENHTEEDWPNLKCHPVTPASDPEYIQQMGQIYKDCISKAIKIPYDCPKVCKLEVDGVITNSYSDTYTIDVDKFIDNFADEIGYDREKPEPAHKQLMDRLRAGLNDCKSEHKEYEGLTSLASITCQPFDNFLNCFEKTIGC